MQRIISASQWKPSDEITLEENAYSAIMETGNILVVAGPGAGKTELLAQKAGYLLQTNTCEYPKKILAISFKTDAAGNLKERVQCRCGKEYADRFSSLTYDAFAKRALDQFRMALPDELQPEKNYVIGEKEIIDKAFRLCGFVNREHLTSSKLAAKYERELSSTPLPLDNKSLSSNVWRLLVKGFHDNPACLTFKMISLLTIYIISTNPFILKSLQATYSHVFLDEFQDTTNIQYDLIKKCFQNSSTILTAVGDSKQRIMVWAGARKTVFQDFQQEFNAKKIPLLMNHRSAPRLVNLQRLMYHSLQESIPDLKTSSKWNETDGSIKLYLSEDEDIEAQYITEDILDKLSTGIALKDICILVKQLPDNYTHILASKLAEQGIRARIETDYQDLLKEFIVNLIINALKVAIDRRSPAEWEYITNAMIDIKGLEPFENSSLYYKEHARLVLLLNEIEGKLNSDTSKSTFKEIIMDILNFFDIEKLKALYPAYSQGNFFETIIDKTNTLLWHEFKICNDWVCSIENFLGQHSIPIMTIHKSKGLEYNAVYFIGLEDGAFWNFRNQPEEDRCAFFVALSRAKEHLIFSFCAHRHKLKYPDQKHNSINEFFELLKTPGISKVIHCE